MTQKYRKKPIVIEAIKWDGKNHVSFLPLFIDKKPSWCNRVIGREDERLEIVTLEGNITARLGDWLIKGVNGEFYPCKPDIFEKTYERVEE